MPSFCCGLTSDDDPPTGIEHRTSKEKNTASVDAHSQTVVIQPLPHNCTMSPKAKEVLCDKVKKESPAHASLSDAYCSMASTPLPLKSARPPTPPLSRQRDAQGFYFGEILLNRPVIPAETVNALAAAAKKVSKRNLRRCNWGGGVVIVDVEYPSPFDSR